MPLTAHVVSWREKYINAPRPWTEFLNLVSVFAWLLSPFLFRADALCQRCQFVILAAFDHTDPNLPVEERVGLGLKRCGVSVTCESVLAGGSTVPYVSPFLALVAVRGAFLAVYSFVLPAAAYLPDPELSV